MRRCKHAARPRVSNHVARRERQRNYVTGAICHIWSARLSLSYVQAPIRRASHQDAHLDTSATPLRRAFRTTHRARVRVLQASTALSKQRSSQLCAQKVTTAQLERPRHAAARKAPTPALQEPQLRANACLAEPVITVLKVQRCPVPLARITKLLVQ